MGGLPDAEATYVGVSPGLPVGEYELTIGPDVPVEAPLRCSIAAHVEAGA